MFIQLESVVRGCWVPGGAPLGVGETFHFRCLNHSVTDDEYHSVLVTVFRLEGKLRLT